MSAISWRAPIKPFGEPMKKTAVICLLACYLVLFATNGSHGTEDFPDTQDLAKVAQQFADFATFKMANSERKALVTSCRHHHSSCRPEPKGD
jgi:hypothetical protein